MEQKALNRYESTWQRFVKELETDSKTTLRAVCKTMHTDYNLMKKWASGSGCSVLKAKAAHRRQIPEDAPSSAFAVLVPKDNPPVHRESFLAGISITFNSGTTINIRQADADSIIRLVSLYERKDGGPCIL